MTVLECKHIPLDPKVLPESVVGCEDCMASGRSDWVHLRICQECDHVACCDSSPNQHATAHFHASGHPLIRSVEPGEYWWSCFVDEIIFEIG